MSEQPWVLHGEGMLAWVAVPGGHAPGLPPVLRPLPGPGAVVAMRYDDSPVGPYLELSVLVPARLGLRVGMCTVAIAVSTSAARLECRRNWGLPAEVGALRWAAGAGGEPDDRVLTWAERGMEVTGRAFGPSVVVPVLATKSVGWRPGGPAVASRRLRARVRRARCAVEVDHDDELAWLAGAHRGAMLTGARIVAGPARRPAGLLSSVPWPAPAGVATLERAGGAATMTSPGRMAQLVRAQPSHG